MAAQTAAPEEIPPAIPSMRARERDISIAAVLFNAINGGRIDWRRYARETAEQLRAGLAYAMASPLIDDPRVVHLRFADIAAFADIGIDPARIVASGAAGGVDGLSIHLATP